MRTRTKVIAAIAAAAVVGVGAYGGYRVWRSLHVPQVDIANATVDRFEIDGEEATVIRGDYIGADAPLVLVTHGYDADERVAMMPYMASFTQDAVDAGWIVAASEAVGDAWGGGDSIDTYQALLDRVEADYGTSDTVIVSLSMGAIPGLHLLADSEPGTFAGWFGVSPVTDLPAMAASEGWDEIIASALTPDEIVALDPARLSIDDGTPLSIANDPADPITPTATQSTPFADRTGADFRACHDGHVGADCFPTVAAMDALR